VDVRPLELQLTIGSDWDNAEVKLIFEAVENTSYAYSLWAPEVHNIDDKWYFILYVTKTLVGAEY
jgi:GH43 family beta-xylosidase